MTKDNQKHESSSNLDIACDDWMLNHRMTTISGKAETAPSLSSVVIPKDKPLEADPAVLSPRYMTWHDRIQHYCERNNLAEQDNEFFSGLLTEVILACSETGKPSASGIFKNPERGKIARNEPESESSTSSVLTPDDTRPYELHHPSEIERLKAIIDSLQAENGRLKKTLAGLALTTESVTATAWAENDRLTAAASNMKAAIIKRVREKAAEWMAASQCSNDEVNNVRKNVGMAIQCIAAELEAVEVGTEELQK